METRHAPRCTAPVMCLSYGWCVMVQTFDRPRGWGAAQECSGPAPGSPGYPCFRDSLRAFKYRGTNRIERTREPRRTPGDVAGSRRLSASPQGLPYFGGRYSGFGNVVAGPERRSPARCLVDSSSHAATTVLKRLQNVSCTCEDDFAGRARLVRFAARPVLSAAGAASEPSAPNRPARTRSGSGDPALPGRHRAAKFVTASSPRSGASSW